MFARRLCPARAFSTATVVAAEAEAAVAKFLRDSVGFPAPATHAGGADGGGKGAATFAAHISDFLAVDGLLADDGARVHDNAHAVLRWLKRAGFSTEPTVSRDSARFADWSDAKISIRVHDAVAGCGDMRLFLRDPAAELDPIARWLERLGLSSNRVAPTLAEAPNVLLMDAARDLEPWQAFLENEVGLAPPPASAAEPVNGGGVGSAGAGAGAAAGAGGDARHVAGGGRGAAETPVGRLVARWPEALTLSVDDMRAGAAWATEVAGVPDLARAVRARPYVLGVARPGKEHMQVIAKRMLRVDGLL